MSIHETDGFAAPDGGPHNVRIEREVRVGLNEIVGRGHLGLASLVSQRMIGSDLLMDVRFSAVRVEDGEIVLQASGDAALALAYMAPARAAEVLAQSAACRSRVAS